MTILLDEDGVSAWVARYPPREPRHRGRVRRGVPGLDSEGVVGGCRADRARARGRPHRARGRRVDRPAGGVADGPRQRGRVRRQAAEQPAGVARLLRGVRAGAGRPPPPAIAFATSTSSCSCRSRCRCGSSTRGGSSRACRSCTRCCSTSWHASLWIGVRGRGRPLRHGRCGRSGCSSRRRSSWPAFASGSTRGLERHRRRLFGRDRGASHRERPGAVRPLSAGGGRGVRPRRSQRPRRAAHPGERALRGAERARRHVRAGDVSGVPARLCDLRLEGEGDPLHAAHFTAIVFDLACILGLVLVGLRYGDRRLAATLAFAWAAYPFTQYVASSSSNDAIQPALLIFGFWLAASPWGRGSLAALASWTKFAPLVVAPLWATYPERRLRPTAFFLAAFAAATLAAFWVLLLEPDPLGAVRTVWDRTIAPPVRPGVALLALGLAPVPRRPARPPPRAARRCRCCCWPALSRLPSSPAASRRFSWPRSRPRC